MKSRLSRLNPISWPIWFKLLVGALIFALALGLPALALLQARAYENALQETRNFTQQNGSGHNSAVTTAIENARTSLELFVANSSNARVLTSMLVGDVRSQIDLNLPRVSETDLVALFNRTLLNPATTMLENVRLLDRNGQIVARSGLDALAIAGSRDESTSPALLGLQAALLRGENSALTVSRGFRPQIDYGVALRWRDGRVIGYLIGRLSNQRALFNNTRFSDAAYGGLTFFAADADSIFALERDLPRAQAGFNPDLVARARAGQSDIAIQQTANAVEVMTFFAPIAGTPLVQFTEVPTASAYAEALNLLTVRVFIAVSAGLTLVAIFVLTFQQTLVPPLQRLRRATQQLAQGNFIAPIPDVSRGDEIGELAGSLETLRESVRALVDDLQARVEARARDFGATQEISRYAATQRDLQVLMDRVVDLIIERFPSIYHAQIFLIDRDREYAVVRASTGPVGQQLKARGHRLAVGSISVIGQVTEQGRIVVARDTAASQVHRRNEFLPDTRAELAIPLRLGDEVIGALDVQSRQADAFDDDLINVLQTMADQLAVAIQNARLYQEAMRRADEIDKANRLATIRAWQEYMAGQRASSIVRSAGVATDADLSELRRRAIAEGKPVIGEPTERSTIPVAVPIILRGQTLGAVEWELPERGFSSDRVDLARELADRLALSLENARLFEESRQAAERERLVNAISARLTTQSTIDDILETAVREVGQALRAPKVEVRLHAPGAYANGEAKKGSNGRGAKSAAAAIPVEQDNE